MDSYVIRIYRRDDNDPANIVGQVEFVEHEETRFFGGAEELMEILVGKIVQKSKRVSQEAANAGEKGKG